LYARHPDFRFFMATELILIRHGHAVRVNGDYLNAPLTKLGKEQAEKTAHFFNQPENRMDALYASPLRRTRETASIIGAITGMNAEPRRGIEEARFPEVMSLLLYELLSITNPVDAYLIHHAGRPIHWPVEGRVSRVLLDILTYHPGQRIGVVAHAGVISASLSWYLPARRWHWWRTTVSNCSITCFRVVDHRATLLEVNDVRHLEPVLVSTQPAARVVEMTKESHPSEKSLDPENSREKNILPK
jgi:broad specificity phosphatase PhoE